MLNIPDRHKLAGFLRGEQNEDGCRGEIAKCIHALLGAEVIAWDGGSESPAELVWDCLLGGWRKRGTSSFRAGPPLLSYLARKGAPEQPVQILGASRRQRRPEPPAPPLVDGHQGAE